MQKNIARKSGQSSSLQESEDFEDLDFNQSVPSNDRVSAECLLDLVNNKEIQTESTGHDFEKDQIIQQLKTENKVLNQDLKALKLKYKSVENDKIDCQKKLEMHQRLSQQLGVKIKKTIQENAQLVYQLNIHKQTVQKLQKVLNTNKSEYIKNISSYDNKIQSLYEQVDFYQRCDSQLRKFLKNQLKIEASSAKSMKSVVEAVISDLKKNLIDISNQIRDLYRCIGQECSIDTNGQYNHWKEISIIQRLGQLILKSRTQLEVNRAMTQTLNLKVQQLEKKYQIPKSSY